MQKGRVAGRLMCLHVATALAASHLDSLEMLSCHRFTQPMPHERGEMDPAARLHQSPTVGIHLTALNTWALAGVRGVTLSRSGLLGLCSVQKVFLMNSGNKAALLHPVPWC